MVADARGWVGRPATQKADFIHLQPPLVLRPLVAQARCLCLGLRPIRGQSGKSWEGSWDAGRH